MRKSPIEIASEFSRELKLIILLSQESFEANKLDAYLVDIDWDLFVKLVLKHRMISPILKNRAYFQEKVPQVIMDRLHKIKRNQSTLSLKYANYVIQIHELFEEQKIEHCFFKGPLLSYELYSDVGFRNFGDIDILVSKNKVERAKAIIENADFKCIYPNIDLSEKQRKINYNISHHYHLKHLSENIHIELHWNISNPQTFSGLDTNKLLENRRDFNVSGHKLPYISAIENIVYLAAHGAIHQWYRLFWLKDFSVLLAKSSQKDIEMAWALSGKLKLERCFLQACQLSKLVFNVEMPNSISAEILNVWYVKTPLNCLNFTELKQQGITGKLQYIKYRLKLKPSFTYYFDLIFRLRTHLSDWEFIRLPKGMFFLYYPLRPLLLLLKPFFKSRN